MQEISFFHSNLSLLLEIAEVATRTAGASICQKLGSTQVVHQKALNDSLLQADLEAERIILTTLRTKTPSLGILSEEAGFEGNREHYWIVDPLDGSTNFQRGNPLFALAIALVIDQITSGSVIYLPMQNEMFTAIRHQGAFLNGKPIAVSQTAKLNNAIAHLGDFAKGNDRETTQERLSDVLALVTSVQRIRMIGTAATDLAYVACGRADLLVNHAIVPWDVEAGKLLLLEAGGKATTKRLNNRTLSLYSNGLVHQEVENVLFAKR